MVDGEEGPHMVCRLGPAIGPLEGISGDDFTTFGLRLPRRVCLAFIRVFGHIVLLHVCCVEVSRDTAGDDSADDTGGGDWALSAGV